MSNDRWLVFTDVPVESMFDGQLYWPYSGSRTVRSDLFRSALRYCTGFKIGAIVSSTYKQSVSDFVRSCDPTGSAQVFTPREFLEAEIGPQAILHALNCDLRRAIYIRSLANRYNWPVVGITHDLSDPKVYDELILSNCGGLRESDAIVCCSAAAATVLGRQLASIRRMLQSRTQLPQLPIIPHGIDLSSLSHPSGPDVRAALAIAPTDFVFLYFGRLCGITKADLLSLLGSFNSAFNGRADVKLLLAGSTQGEDDDYYLQLRRRVAELHLQDQVSLFSNPDAILKADLYAGADVFISPASSLQESFGITVLEAMAYELPIIASDWNGYRDLVLHERTGFLFNTQFVARPAIDPSETPFESWPTVLDNLQDGISLDFDACEKFMKSCERGREKTKEMGRAGRRRVTQLFEWKGIMRRYQECWSHLLEMSWAGVGDVDPNGSWLFPHFNELFAGHDSFGCQRDA